MRFKSPSMRLTGAKVLRDGQLQRSAVSLKDGHIASGAFPEVDLSGYLILPGIIDLHGDGFERQILPRPRADFSLDQGLVATDREAAANGITTAWLAQSWSWEGGHRSPDFAEKLLDALDTYQPRAQTDLRVQIRCETHTTDTFDRLVAAVERHRVGYVVFNNHLEQGLQMIQAGGDELAVWAKSAGRSTDQHAAIIREAEKQSSAVPRYLCRLAEAFDRLGAIYGSHDDRTAEVRETFSMIGAKICEFPLSRPVAKLAHAVGDPIIMGAPNVVRGGSQSGNVNALDLIAAGHCDALVSDYYYPSLAKAAFKIVDLGVLDLPEAWGMISKAPARMMGLTDRGSIAPGMRADLAIVNEETLDVEATLVQGRITHLTGDAARRFLSASGGLAIAAE